MALTIKLTALFSSTLFSTTVCRGETFRKEFLAIGEARSLVPSHVNMMALTATATRATRTEVCELLGMIQPQLVSQSPNRENIKYCVRVATTIEDTFSTLVDEIKHRRLSMDRIIILCRTYDNAARIYLYLRRSLGCVGVEPIGAPDLSMFRLVELFTACTHPPVKESILNSFSNVQGSLRIVVATIAFGMGLDCPNVRRVIHWGASTDIEAYMQETGRAGRDGLPAEAILYVVTDPSNRFLDESMKGYCKNKEECRRKLLLRDFDGSSELKVTSSCCDICETH